MLLVLLSQSGRAILSSIQPPWSPWLQLIPPVLLHWLQLSLRSIHANRLKDGELQERIDHRRVPQLGVAQHLVRVDVDAMGGQVASLLPLPGMWLVIWPSCFWVSSFPHILETTRAADHVHDIDFLARDWSRNGEASTRHVWRGEEIAKCGFLADLAGTSRRLVESSGKRWGFWNGEWVASQDCGKGREFPVGRDQRFPG